MNEQPPADGSYWQRPQGWQPPAEATVPRRRIGRSVWVVAALVALLAVALVAWRLWPSQADDVQLAAERFVAATADGDCDRAAELATGEVADQIGTFCDEQSVGGLSALLGDQKPAVEVTDVNGDEAEASVAASVMGVALRVEMSMLREDDQWRVAGLRLPGGIPPELISG